MVIKFTRYIKTIPTLINERICGQNEEETFNNTSFLTMCVKYAIISTLLVYIIDLKYIIIIAAWREVIVQSPFAMLLINYVFVLQLPRIVRWAYVAFLYVLDLVLPRIVG